MRCPPTLALDGGGREPEQIVFDSWNDAADRVARWPRAKRLDADRRKLIRARVKGAGGVAQVLAVLADAEASEFTRERQRGFTLDWFLSAQNFRKVSEGVFADDKQPRFGANAGDHPQQPTGRMAAMAGAKELIRRHKNRGAA